MKLTSGFLDVNISFAIVMETLISQLVILKIVDIKNAVMLKFCLNTNNILSHFKKNRIYISYMCICI